MLTCRNTVVASIGISTCRFRKAETSKWVVLEPICASNTFVPSLHVQFVFLMQGHSHTGEMEAIFNNRRPLAFGGNFGMESPFGETIPRRARMKICNFIRHCSFHWFGEAQSQELKLLEPYTDNIFVAHVKIPRSFVVLWVEKGWHGLFVILCW